MPQTRPFKSGNSQAIRIPAELAYTDTTQPLTITRTGDVITIFPTRGDLLHAVQALRQMPKPETPDHREPIEMPDRENA